MKIVPKLIQKANHPNIMILLLIFEHLNSYEYLNIQYKVQFLYLKHSILPLLIGKIFKIVDEKRKKEKEVSEKKP